MRYFDTSFLVPLILPEPTSGPVGTFFKGLSRDFSALSLWTQVEFASVHSRTVREGRLDEAGARSANLSFEALVDRYFVVLAPNRDDFERARDLIGRRDSSLRSGDALHLAIAGNRGASAIYSLDKQMITAGTALGLPVSAGDLPGYGAMNDAE